MKRLLKKPPPKLRPLKRLLKKAPTPLLLALKPLLLVPTLPLPALKLLLRPTPLLLLRLLTLLPLRPLTPRLLLRLKKRSKSQPFGALTETRNGRSSFGKAAFFFACLLLCPPFSSKTHRWDRLVPMPCLRRGQ
ncbi:MULTISPECIES: hypothetical protein [unclassified Sphingopyxis]|uniref:hypothetical protein n=1 Tax=unclassified Sphingopyxis TaxID=2614943 RepID=UPI00187C16B6|nr:MULTISPECIES: hypothetical protein [unclassified Sphingopyxis]USI79012.1 hypothetical protein KEC45_09020 [Sphingopyxis sp. USTB-05]